MHYRQAHRSGAQISAAITAAGSLHRRRFKPSMLFFASLAPSASEGVDHCLWKPKQRPVGCSSPQKSKRGCAAPAPRWRDCSTRVGFRAWCCPRPGASGDSSASLKPRLSVTCSVSRSLRSGGNREQADATRPVVPPARRSRATPEGAAHTRERARGLPRPAGIFRMTSTSDSALPPMTAAELRHYDEATNRALDRYPPLPADAPEAERLARAREISAYRDALMSGWTDEEHQRRMEAIRNGNTGATSGTDGRHPEDHDQAGGTSDASGGAADASGVVLTPAATIRPAPIAWFMRDRLPMGALSLVVGIPGEGKSTFLVDCAARASRGTLEGDFHGKPVAVALATAEDALAEVMVPRLTAAGANLELVKFVQVKRDGTTGNLVLTSEAIAKLEQLVQREQIRFLVLDPVVALFPGKIDTAQGCGRAPATRPTCRNGGEQPTRTRGGHASEQVAGARSARACVRKHRLRWGGAICAADRSGPW